MRLSKLVASYLKLNNVRLLVACLMLATEPEAFGTSSAESDITMGNPVYSGSGCPSESTSFTLAPDEKSISFLFDQFHVQTGGETGNLVDIKKCRIKIPMTTPRGVQVAIVQLDYRGYNNLPAGARSKLETAYSFTKPNHLKFIKNKTSYHTERFGSSSDHVDENYTFTHKPKRLLWSRCGGDFNLLIQAQMKAKTNVNEEETLSTVDSIDGSTVNSDEGSSNNIKYHFATRSCQK